MPRYFEEDDDDAELNDHGLDDRGRGEPRRDTEVTLSWGALLAMALGLLAICAVCFGLGYSVGHRSATPAHATAPSSQSNAPDQEPLQGSGSVPKPSANAQAAVPPLAPPKNIAASSTEGGASPEAAAPGSGSGAPSSTLESAPTGAPPVSPQVRPALGANAPEPSRANATGPNVQAALPSPNSLMVQVAAVKNEEDAGVLTNALRRRGYPVISHRDPADGLIHVRIGPFPTREEANQWRMKLLNDGYNAIVQP
jgi:DedD protein